MGAQTRWAHGSSSVGQPEAIAGTATIATRAIVAFFFASRTISASRTAFELEARAAYAISSSGVLQPVPISGTLLGVYTRTMCRSSAPIALIAAVSLLTLQLSGLHMHVDEHGYVGAPVGTHLHSQAAHHHGNGGELGDHSDDHDFDGSKDLAVVELSAGASKLVLALVLLALALPILLRQSAVRLPTIVIPVLSGRRTRWRPPLRAPPLRS